MTPRIQALRRAQKGAADQARNICKLAEATGRRLDPAEKAQVEKLIEIATNYKSEAEALEKIEAKVAGVEHAVTAKGDGLLARFKAAGWNPAEQPRASIPFREFYAASKAATLEAGDINALNRIENEGAPLGYDERRLYPNLPMETVDAGATSVETFRQLSRTLAAPGDMQRAIDATSEKPETSSQAEVEALALKQIATKQSGIPNILLTRPAFATMVQQDLRLAFEDAVDDLVIDAINAGPGPTQQLPTGDTFREVRQAITTLQASGFDPNLVALSPEMAEDLDLFQDGSTDLRYVFATSARQTGASPLWGLKIAVVKNLVNAFVIDTSAIGRLYLSPVSLASFEENDGATNTTLVRIEANGNFGVERPTAAVEILTGS